MYTRLFDAAAAVRLWQWCVKHHHGVVKVLAQGRATSETQQGEIDRSVHTPLYHPARLPLCPAHFGVATNYIVSPKNRSPNNRRSSVHFCQKSGNKVMDWNNETLIIVTETLAKIYTRNYLPMINYIHFFSKMYYANLIYLFLAIIITVWTSLKAIQLINNLFKNYTLYCIPLNNGDIQQHRSKLWVHLQKSYLMYFLHYDNLMDFYVIWRCYQFCF